MFLLLLLLLFPPSLPSPPPPPTSPCRDFVIVLEPYVQLEKDFLECFLYSPRAASYNKLFSSKDDNWYKSIHSDGNLLAILQEVSHLEFPPPPFTIDRIKPIPKKISQNFFPKFMIYFYLSKGITFLDTVLDVSRKRQWLGKDMDEEIKEWLTMFLTPIDITNERAESYLKDFLTTKMGGVTKLYSEHIKRNASSNLIIVHCLI